MSALPAQRAPEVPTLFLTIANSPDNVDRLRNYEISRGDWCHFLTRH